MLSDKLILELLAKSEGHALAPFCVYVPTSAPTGDHFVRYNLVYEYSDVRDNYAPCSTTNVSNYRIREAHLVRVDAVDAERVACEAICEVLQKGEISLAIREDLKDTAHLAPGATPITKGDECFSADFIGGYHGDERLRDVALTADGITVDLCASTPRTLPCTVLDFTQTTTLYRWGTSNAESYGTPVAEHTQHITFQKDGLRNHQSVRFACDGFHARPSATFLQMFTMKREQKGVYVCEFFEIFDENGHSLGRVEPSLPVAKTYNALPTDKGCRVRYGSASSGITGEVGFRILNDSLSIDRTWVQVREKQGDNKWYASFASPKNGHIPRRGECWELELFAHIDYTGSSVT